MILIILLVLILVFICYFFIGWSPQAEKIIWGVNFSQKHAENLGLDWKETYLAILEDLKVKNLKLITQWDLIEAEKDNFYFDDLDWQIDTAENRGVEILLVIGMKTGRWPECHLPEWAKNLNKEEVKERILKLIEKIVRRYRYSDSIRYWQVENEPFFPFGECPFEDKKFLRKEIELVKSLDFNKRPVIISDSGELSLWMKTATFGDFVGITLHRKVWFREIKSYVSYPFPPVYYWRKSQLIKKLFKKEVICVELQAEPWGFKLLYDVPLEQQKKTMDFERFQKNIEFAKKTGLKEFYLWGSEWWFWLKEKQNQPEIWNEAKKLF
jgi:hypothetical protein